MARHHVILEILARGVIQIGAIPLRGVLVTFMVVTLRHVAPIRLIKEIQIRGEIQAVEILVFRIDRDII